LNAEIDSACWKTPKTLDYTQIITQICIE